MTTNEKFIIARWAYNIGKDFISDIEYDRLEKKVADSGELEEYINRGWSEDPCPAKLLIDNNLSDFIKPVIFSFKTESIESVNDEDMLNQLFSFLKIPSRLSMKLDGFSLRLNYYNGMLVYASLRNRNNKKDVLLLGLSRLFKQTISLKGRVLVTGELYLKKKTFKEYKKLRGIESSRNGVSTAIANNDIEYLDYKCYNIFTDDSEQSNRDKYELLKELGFQTPKYVMVNNYKELLSAIEVLSKFKDFYDSPTDGLVLENADTQKAIRLGKWKEENNFSFVLSYTLNRGMYGDFILCKIYPRKFNGKTVSEISVNSMQFLIDYNLRPGAPIAFVERSGVNSVFDSDHTEQLHETWEGQWDKFKESVIEIEKYNELEER